MLQGEADAPTVIFRLPADTDFEALAGIRRDPRMQAMLMAIPDRTDNASVRDWIERRVNEPGGLFRVMSQPGGPALGFIQISQVSLRDRYGYGAVAVRDDCRLPGVALLAMRELMRAARFDLGLLKLMAEIRADNTDSIRMNYLCGYKLIGTLESHFVDADGQRHDVVLLQKKLPPAN
ncbi:hypothetical protein GCM10007301_30350 [Azorhizobium oxalatiphilum]|uniref:N-acetyltransferase domain-containing protein n=1 Tax=Azorhizobium oxalatiphilum TaxID=980631 RepID=A0A917C261_9HYPH|nr:GNAT family N-acetyltransferase [Azorhizobium oxalatiphilum]GGF68619.1 hypothetical protein GCM10007301_30350 [Azorhizobium oxalatiphilum]